MWKQQNCPGSCPSPQTKAMNREFGKQNELYKHISCCNNPYWNVSFRLCSNKRISSTGKDKEWDCNTVKQLTTHGKHAVREKMIHIFTISQTDQLGGYLIEPLVPGNPAAVFPSKLNQHEGWTMLSGTFISLNPFIFQTRAVYPKSPWSRAAKSCLVLWDCLAEHQLCWANPGSWTMPGVAFPWPGTFFGTVCIPSTHTEVWFSTCSSSYVPCFQSHNWWWVHKVFPQHMAEFSSSEEKGAQRKDEERLFTRTWSHRTRGNDLKLK